MLNKIILLTKKLISFKTTENNMRGKADCFKYIEKYLSVNKKLVIRKFKTNTGNALLISNTKNGLRFCFNGHIDVVAADVVDFNAQVKGGKIYGRGAIDMKAAVAVLIEIFRNLRVDAPSVGLLLVDDEEQRAGCSTATVIKQVKLKPKFSIVAEQTDFSLVVKQKGTINISIVSQGKSAHGAEPKKGINAITKLCSVLQKIEKNKIFSQRNNFCPTCVISTISGGEATNSVPALACATINIRYTNAREAREIQKLLRQIQGPGLSVEAKVKPCFETGVKNIFLQQLKKIVKEETKRSVSFISSSTGSDAKYFSASGLPAVVFGPVGGNYHADNEWVEIASLEKYYKILNKFIYNNNED